MAEQARADGVATRVVRIDPRALRLLESNARYMTHEQYKLLVQNVRRDGGLTSVPFAAKDADGRYTVLSGNHRVRAAIDAGLEQIDVLVTDDPLTPDQRLAIQLSHNALVGQDDPAMLARLYSQIGNLDLRIYSGLDDKTLGLLEKVSPDSVSELNLEYRTLTFVFLPPDAEHVDRVFAEAMERVAAKKVYLADKAEFYRLLDALEKAEKATDVHNRALLLRVVLDVFERHAEDLEAMYGATADA